MIGLFILLALGAAFFALPGGNRAIVDRQVAQFAAIAALSCALFMAHMAVFGIILLINGAALFGIGWQRERMMDQGFQDLDDHEGTPPQAAAIALDAMSSKEAYAVLGLALDAPEPEIQEAYRRMIAQAHPDKGGSDYLAAKVNQARDVLLG